MSQQRTAPSNASKKTPQKNHLFKQWIWVGDGVGVSVYVRENKAIMVGLKGKPMGADQAAMTFVHLDRLNLLMLQQVVEEALKKSA